MSGERIYLDHNASTPLLPEVREAMKPYLNRVFANPSSGHQDGVAARCAVDQARQQIAGLLGARPDEIIFCGGGTLADNIAILGSALAWRAANSAGGRFITQASEHNAVLQCLSPLQRMGFETIVLGVDRSGRISPDELRRACSPDSFLISIMTANNETGTLQPIDEIGAIASEYKIPFHSDAIQVFGNLALCPDDKDIGMLSLSAHKFNGPKGVGALYVKRGIRLEPIFFGGSQERRFAPGTENVSGIVGMAEALALAFARQAENAERRQLLRDELEQGIMAIFPEALVNGDQENRLPNTLNVSFPGIPAQALLVRLDLDGVSASTGAACSSGAAQSSHVLKAMGLSADVVNSALRFSLGSQNCSEDIPRTLSILKEIITSMR